MRLWVVALAASLGCTTPQPVDVAPPIPTAASSPIARCEEIHQAFAVPYWRVRRQEERAQRLRVYVREARKGWLKIDENARDRPTINAEVITRFVRGDLVPVLADECGQGFALVLWSTGNAGSIDVALYVPSSVLSAEPITPTRPMRELMAKKCIDLQKQFEQADHAARTAEEVRRVKAWSRSAPLTFGYRYAFERPVLVRHAQVEGAEAAGLEVQWRALSVLEDDCGEGWMLVSVPHGDNFFAGYIRRGQVAGERPFAEGCRSDLVDREDRLIAAWHEPVLKTRPVFVLASAVMVRSSPDVTAPVVLKLGYGAPVDFVSEDCEEGWSIIATAGGIGYVKREWLGGVLFTEEQLVAKESEALSIIEKAFWGRQRAHRFPSFEAHDREWVLQAQARRSLRPSDQGPCDTFFGSCAVVAYDNDPSKLDAAKLADLAKVPVAPWWILPSATEAAVPGVFHAARISRSGECDCCGCESCQTVLDVELERLGETGKPARILGGSRRPPATWFQPVSAASCADLPALERIVGGDPKWQAELSARAAGALERGAPSAPRCLPASDGSAWWTQSFGESDTDWPTHFSAHIVKGNVVRIEHREPVAARDLDGDGDVDMLWTCAYGGLCTAGTERIRSGP